MSETKKILRRCVVRHTDAGIALAYHDRAELTSEERELPGDDLRDYVNDSGMFALLHGEDKVFTQNDQSYPKLARAFYA